MNFEFNFSKLFSPTQSTDTSPNIPPGIEAPSDLLQGDAGPPTVATDAPSTVATDAPSTVATDAPSLTSNSTQLARVHSHTPPDLDLTPSKVRVIEKQNVHNVSIARMQERSRANVSLETDRDSGY
jgi:hypothetical protein